MSDTTDSQVIQRYEVQSYDSEAWMNPEDDGGYITYADHQAAIATMQKELADFEEDLATYMQISNDLTNENVEFCNKIENQTKELAECQLANKQMRDALAEIKLDSTDINSFRTADKALSIPSTTDALDAYVSEAVKVEREAIVELLNDMNSNEYCTACEYVDAIRARNEKV